MARFWLRVIGLCQELGLTVAVECSVMHLFILLHPFAEGEAIVGQREVEDASTPLLLLQRGEARSGATRDCRAHELGELRGSLRAVYLWAPSACREPGLQLLAGNSILAPSSSTSKVVRSVAVRAGAGSLPTRLGVYGSAGQGRKAASSSSWQAVVAGRTMAAPLHSSIARRSSPLYSWGE